MSAGSAEPRRARRRARRRRRRSVRVRLRARSATRAAARGTPPVAQTGPCTAQGPSRAARRRRARYRDPSGSTGSGARSRRAAAATTAPRGRGLRGAGLASIHDGVVKGALARLHQAEQLARGEALEVLARAVLFERRPVTVLLVEEVRQRVVRVVARDVELAARLPA